MHIIYMNINRESQKYTEIYNVIVSSYMYKHSNRKLPDHYIHQNCLGLNFYSIIILSTSPLTDMQVATVNYFIITKHSVLAYTDKYTVIRILTESLKVAFLFQLAYTYTRFKIEHASCYSCIFSN